MALLIPFILLALFFVLRANPQRRRAQAQQAMMGSLTPGTRVVTAGGVIGTLVGISGDRAAVELAPGVVVEFLLGAITRPLADDDPSSSSDGATDATVADGAGHDLSGPEERNGHDVVPVDDGSGTADPLAPGHEEA